MCNLGVDRGCPAIAGMNHGTTPGSRSGWWVPRVGGDGSKQDPGVALRTTNGRPRFRGRFAEERTGRGSLGASRTGRPRFRGMIDVRPTLLKVGRAFASYGSASLPLARGFACLRTGEGALPFDAASIAVGI